MSKVCQFINYRAHNRANKFNSLIIKLRCAWQTFSKSPFQIVGWKHTFHHSTMSHYFICPGQSTVFHLLNPPLTTFCSSFEIRSKSLNIRITQTGKTIQNIRKRRRKNKMERTKKRICLHNSSERFFTSSHQKNSRIKFLFEICKRTRMVLIMVK